MAEADRHWTESDSRTFIDIADIAIAGREEAIEMLVSLVPASPTDDFAVLDIGCGPGVLLAAVLERFPSAYGIGVDASELMRAEASQRLERTQRGRVIAGDIGDTAWMAQVKWPVRCIMSSLAIHHIEGSAKQDLFQELASRLEPGGALLICDVVEAANDTIKRAFTAQWHTIAHQQSLASTGSAETYERAVSEGWAPRDTLEPEPGEMPSRLAEQLHWLQAAGLQQVDCFWMRAGIAIYGGYR